MKKLLALTLLVLPIGVYDFLVWREALSPIVPGIIDYIPPTGLCDSLADARCDPRPRILRLDSGQILLGTGTLVPDCGGGGGTARPRPRKPASGGGTILIGDGRWKEPQPRQVWDY